MQYVITVRIRKDSRETCRAAPAKHRVPDLITTKRNGGHLSQDEIQHFIEGIVSGDVQDVQAGKL